MQISGESAEEFAGENGFKKVIAEEKVVETEHWENVSEGDGKVLTSRHYFTTDKSLSKSFTYTNESNEIVNTNSKFLRKIDQNGNYAAYFSQTFIKNKQYSYGNEQNANEKFMGRDLQEWTILIFQAINAFQ